MYRLKTAHGNFTVYLNQLASPEGILYHISFVDATRKTQIVRMSRIANQYEFVEPGDLPEWITSSKSEFESLIRQENYGGREAFGIQRGRSEERKLHP